MPEATTSSWNVFHIDWAGDLRKVFAWGISAAGNLSCGLAERFVEKGQKHKLAGIMNIAGGNDAP